jgi:23S rRNA pseudouridine1911/1915/1917 synthase
MPLTDKGWTVTAEEIEAWTLYRDRDLLVINKPGLVLCHPSKHGPWSSLVGACREYLGVGVLHMPSRLDRETSGVVVLAVNASLASRLQTGIQQRKVTKLYHAILSGEMREAAIVDEPIGPAPGAQVIMRQAVVAGGQQAHTEFFPVSIGRGHTLARVHPATGRLHQIRVHAQWLGHPVAGDKIYGSDETLFIDFIRDGWTARLAAMLPMRRHALHASRWSFRDETLSLDFTGPTPPDFDALLQEDGLVWDS